jgi:hypothetical protein
VHDDAVKEAVSVAVAVDAAATAAAAAATAMSSSVDFGGLMADEAQSFDPSLQVVAAKYLVGVFILDSLAMAVRA